MAVSVAVAVCRHPDRLEVFYASARASRGLEGGESWARSSGRRPHKLLAQQVLRRRDLRRDGGQGHLGHGALGSSFDAGFIDGFVNGSRHLTVGLGADLREFFDKYFVDGLVNLMAGSRLAVASSSVALQTGLVSQYALVVS